MRTRRKRDALRRSIAPHIHYVNHGRIEPPVAVLVDRDIRAAAEVAAPRSLTALLLGDPAPGRSALDRLLLAKRNNISADLA